MRGNPPRFLETPSQLPSNLSFVLSISPSAMTLGLGNMQKLLGALQHPERRFRSVLVAGTNGKGSVTAYLSALLKNNGRHVGWYSSPHVYSVAERIRVDCRPVTIEEMERAAAQIVPLYDAIGYSYFEALTAIAFLIFAERGVELAVLETGLGGRFDATNVVDPELCILTSIGLDHRRILGDTEEEILREKLGIARTRVPLIVGPLRPKLATLVAERAARDGIPLVPMDTIGSIQLEEMSFSTMRVRIRTGRRDYGVVSLPAAGRHQMANAMLALGAAERLVDPVENLDAAARDARVEGRFEVHTCGAKTVVLDVAHNDDALVATATTLAELSDPACNAVVLGVLRRKELTRFPQEASRWVRRIYLIQPPPPDWLAPAQLVESVGLAGLRDRGLDIVMEKQFDNDEAWDRFVDHLLSPITPYSAILITGSHRIVESFGHCLRRRP